MTNVGSKFHSAHKEEGENKMRVLRARSILVCICSIITGLALTCVSSAKIDSKDVLAMWLFDDADLKKEIQELWEDWVQEADADGILSFYGLQALAARALIEGRILSERIRRSTLTL